MINFSSLLRLLNNRRPALNARVQRAVALLLLLALLPLLGRAGTPVLTLQSTVAAAPGVDVTAFVDAVELLNANTGAVVANAVLNSSFESHGPIGSYAYTPSVSNWTLTGRSGLNAFTGGLGPPPGTVGAAAAFLQTYIDGGSAISQTLPALPAGNYQLRMILGQRNYGAANQGVAILVDGREVGRSVPANDNAYHSYTTAAFVVDAVLRLEGTVTTADVTAFVDAVELLDATTGNPVAGTPVANASFETFTAPLSNGTFGYRPAGATWAFLDGSGIAAGGSGFNNPTTSPAGSYVALLQARSSFSQVVPQAVSGTYKVRLQLAQRNTAPANQGVRVYLNDVLLGTFVPGIGGFQTYTTGSFTPQPPLVINSFSPGSGQVGSSVVITGTNFTGATAVAFNGTAAPGFVVNSNTQITVTVPAGATNGPISVTNAATATSTASFGIEYWMPAAITTCSGTLFDPAGPNDYYTLIDQTTILTPATAGAKVRLTFGGFHVNGAVSLSLYDGPNTSAPLIGRFTTNPGTVTATNASGQLTARFVSGSVSTSNGPGFDAAISCVTGTPTVDSFTPTTGPFGTSVVLTGTNFTGATAVTFNGTPAPGFVVNSSTQITVAVPVGATAGRIGVTTAIGTGSSTSHFTPSPPTISSFTPTSGSSGTSVVLTGTNFTGATDVFFNGMTTRVQPGSTSYPTHTVNSPTQITVAVPTAATTGPISVITPNGTGTSATNFVTDNYWFPPAITSCTGTLYNLGGPGGGFGLPAGTTTTTLTPATAGGKVRLTFAPNGGIRNAVVSFYDGPDTNAPLIASFTTLNVSGATYFSPGPITATSAGGQLTMSLASGPDFRTPIVEFNAAISCVTGTPNVSSFTPTSGGQGVSVVITGTNFTNATAVFFNGASLANRVAAPGFVINSPTQITVPVPAGAPLGRISVSNANGAGSSPTNFTPLPPVISSFTPTSGAAGTSVVITGTSFTGTTAVAFNGVAAPGFVVNSPTQITVPVPAGVVAGPIRVTTTLGTGASSGVFGSDVILIGTAAITTCSGNIYDSGGPNGPYGNNENLTTTISPGTPGAKVRLLLSGIDIRGGSDALRVYDGPNTGSPQIGYFAAYQSGSTHVLTATNPTGQLTLQFQSISTNYYLAGFAAAISCVTPTISSFTPTSGAAGTSVVITGTEFSGASAVSFNGVPAPGFVVNSDTQITVPVPAGNANGLLSVTAPYGTATSTVPFTVVAPTLTAVSPFIGVPGSVVTLTGTNLTGTSSITFYGSAGQRTVSTGFSVNAAGTQLTGVLVPAGAQSGPITATTGGGTTPVGPALFSRASVVAAGGGHTVAVRPDGSLWAWGDNANGQLGLGTIGGQQNSPVRVGTGNTWASASTGSGHTVAVQTDGTLWAWGSNNKGQLGLGSTTTQASPQRVGLATTWASATAGTSYTVAVRADGTLWAWGLNASGQLGLGSNTDWTTPQQVGGVSNWTSAAAGGGHTVAIRADGTLWTWGLNANGQLGLSTTNQNAPQRVGLATTWASAAAGSTHTTAVRTDGTLYAWGNNASGQLGLGSTGGQQNSPQLVGTATSWMSAAAGDAHSLTVQADGSLWAWGSNANGQLGLGNTTNQNTPQAVAALTSWASAAAGASHSAGEQSCGAVWAWGLNGSGQVGDGSTTQRPSPVLIFNPISLLTFSPSTAGGYNPVTVTGANLAGLTALTVNGVSALASVTNSTATGFTFVVPAGAPLGAGTVSVSAGCGSGSSTAFTVGPPSPLVNTLSRAAELPGQPVVLTGLNFTNGSTVSFGGVAAASVIYTSPTSLTAVVPVGATPGPSAVVVSNVNGSSPSSPAFEVLQVYRGTAASGCLPTASLSLPSAGAAAGNWQYLRLPGAGGAVVAAIEHTRNLGTVTVSVSALGTATGTPVRDDGNGRAYLDRNFTLTATNKTFAGQTVKVRFFGLISELDRLTAVDANATLAGLKASQYSGYNENCTLLDNDPAGERRLLAAPATALAGADWFTAQVSVTDHFSEFYLTGAATPLLAPSQAPLLTNVSPVRSLPTAPLGANVALTFSQPIDATTAGNVRVFGSQRSGQLVRGGNAMASGNTITVDPARGFAPGERVFVTVPATVQGTNGYNTVPKVHEFTAETAQAPATFLDAPAVYTMQAQSQNVVVGDLNGDGVLDVVTSDFYGGSNATGSVVVRFGLGNGQLGPLVEYNDFYPEAITLADVDGDGDLDLVTTAPYTGGGSRLNGVYTRLNNGSGSFSTITTTSVLDYPTHTVLGDVDGDGDLDMLTAASRASLSFNNSGTFTTTVPTAVLTNNVVAVDVALGDVDGDGDLDALVANGSLVSVRLNNSRGVFSGTYNVTMGGAMTKLVVGDVDGDGDLDLATSSSATSTVSVRLNNGDGTFGGGGDYPLAFAPNTLALGDVDGDGDLDLVTAGNVSGVTTAAAGQAVVRLNNGSGAFSGGSNVGTGGSQPFVALGDMDGDGTLDLLTSHAGNSRGGATSTLTYDYAELFIRLNTGMPATITALSAAAELPGMPVTLTGTGFTAGSSVSFGGVAAGSVTVNSPTSLTATVPAGAAAGTSPVVVTVAAGSSLTAPAFTVLAVYDGGTLDACAAAVPPTPSLNDGSWHYLLAGNGQVVAAYNYTGASLGSLAIDVLRADPAQPVRQDPRQHHYLGRNWHLTASAGRFDGRTVGLRLYGLNSEQARLQVADPTATLVNLKATQYSGPNEDCQLTNNVASAEHRTLAAPASSPGGTVYFRAELAVADHFSEFYLTGSSAPLPVELVRFTAEKRGTTVALAWATASEKNSARFEVERSRDGRTFERIGQVVAAGSSTSRHDYDFLDASYPGETDVLYYRLRQVDLDGAFSYSPVRAVTVGRLAGLVLFPNPTTGAATLTGTVPGTVVQVYDALGRKVVVATADATGTAALLLPQGLPAGVYVVRVGGKALRLTMDR